MRKRDLLLVLAGNETGMARAEAELLLGNHGTCDGRLCRLSSEEEPVRRLAYTHQAHEILASCTHDSLLQTISTIRVTEESFAVRTHRGVKQTPRQAGEHLKDANPAARVDLQTPRGEYHVFSFENRLCITRLLWRNKEDFAGRRSHKRPGGGPISLHPRLARCMVNLTGIRSGTLVDPCCGTGGMLIEAGLMGLHPSGYDIDPGMIDRSRQALEFFNIHGRLKQRDCRALGKTFRYMTTDIPYGRNTSPPQKDFINAFMQMVSRVVNKRAVISADSRQHLPLPKNCRLSHEFCLYIHKSLTKKIYVIEKLRKNTA